VVGVLAEGLFWDPDVAEFIIEFTTPEPTAGVTMPVFAAAVSVFFFLLVVEGVIAMNITFP
jgi:hypothetical protein